MNYSVADRCQLFVFLRNIKISHSFPVNSLQLSRVPQRTVWGNCKAKFIPLQPVKCILADFHLKIRGKYLLGPERNGLT